MVRSWSRQVKNVAPGKYEGPFRAGRSRRIFGGPNDAARGEEGRGLGAGPCRRRQAGWLA